MKTRFEIRTLQTTFECILASVCDNPHFGPVGTVPCKVQVTLKFRSNLSFLCMVVYHAVECLEVLALKEVFSSFLSLLKPY